MSQPSVFFIVKVHVRITDYLNKIISFNIRKCHCQPLVDSRAGGQLKFDPTQRWAQKTMFVECVPRKMKRKLT